MLNLSRHPINRTASTTIKRPRHDSPHRSFRTIKGRKGRMMSETFISCHNPQIAASATHLISSLSEFFEAPAADFGNGLSPRKKSSRVVSRVNGTVTVAKARALADPQNVNG